MGNCCPTGKLDSSTVGVSGNATGEQDEACAREGLKAIQSELEMAGM